MPNQPGEEQASGRLAIPGSLESSPFHSVGPALLGADRIWIYQEKTRAFEDSYMGGCSSCRRRWCGFQRLSIARPMRASRKHFDYANFEIRKIKSLLDSLRCRQLHSKPIEISEECEYSPHKNSIAHVSESEIEQCVPA